MVDREFIFRIGEILAKLTSLDNLDQKDHRSEDQQDMDEPSQCIGADESESPEDKKNDGDSVEHNGGRFGVMFW